MKKTFLTLLAILIAASSFAQFKIGEHETLFKRGDKSIAEYRIPSMITTKNRTVLAVCDGRVDRGGDVPNNIDLVIRRLEKGDNRWTPIQTIVDFAGDHGAADPSLVQDSKTGRIFLFFGFCPGRNDVTIGANRERRHLMLQYVYSDDDGKSWSAPLHVDYQIRKEGWQSVWSGPGRGVQMKNGRIVVPCTINKETKVMATVLVYSDDNGDSWSVKEVEESINEPTIAELDNGDLIINARNQREGEACRAITYSNDGGETWSKALGREDLPDPNCQASMIEHDGLLIQSNCNSIKGRKNMTIRISDDYGKTWKYETAVYEGPSAYSCLTIMPNGNIGLLYETGEKSAYESIKFVEIAFNK